MLEKILKSFVCLSLAVLAAGCAAPVKQLDYTAFKQSRPKSILILPPLNESPDVKATYSMLSQMSYPLAEAGYYVLPVALVDETLKQNGMTAADDIHAIAPAKLQEIFGADAALYVTVSKYGSVYTVINSAVVVTANAKLIDLKSGELLWSGSASASSAEANNNSGGGLIGALVAAAVNQIVNSVSDRGHDIAALTSQRLLSTRQPNGILYGPHSPKYGTD
ncbi:DUF799 domain-containing protein [Collimonas sp. H4R21]|jgi:hypothetical protein|uniref:DUF799 domain-containing protein n=1 Tax=Collimonas rhizosphaerae TaxID=3126357 RepID=A0ABU9Q055_9BURK|nr:DUF799 domain-containing protein [Collimonas sp. OK412]SFB74631.1 hypothetical protein SAMN04515619_101334 [Collimonas sp. OK412]